MRNRHRRFVVVSLLSVASRVSGRSARFFGFYSPRVTTLFSARPDEGLLPPDVALRYASLAGIVGIASFVLFLHRSPVAIALTVIACIAIVLIERRIDQSFIPDEAKRVLKS